MRGDLTRSPGPRPAFEPIRKSGVQDASPTGQQPRVCGVMYQGVGEPPVIVVSRGDQRAVGEMVQRPLFDRSVQEALDDGRPGGFYVPRFRNLSSRHPDFIRAYGFEGSSGAQMVPGHAAGTPGFGAGFKKSVRDRAGAFINMGGFGEVLARYENQVDLDPVRKDKWGIPVLRFNYRFGDNEKKMCADMADAAQEMFEYRPIVSSTRAPL